MSFGAQVQARQNKLLARGQTVDGRVVSVHEMEYSEPIAGIGSFGVAVDVGGSQGAGAVSVGFANLDDAKRYLTGLDAENYTVTDNMGRQLTETRVGLGIPDGMIRWTDGNGGGGARLAPPAAAIIPPNAAQYPQQAAALNSPPDAADQPHGSLSGEGAQRGNTVDTRQGGTIAATPVTAPEVTGGDPKADGDGQGAGQDKADKNHDNSPGTGQDAKNKNK